MLLEQCNNPRQLCYIDDDDSLSAHLQCVVSIILSADRPASGDEDKIGTRWDGEQ